MPPQPLAWVDYAQLDQKRRAREPHQYGPGFDLSVAMEQKISSLGIRVMLRDAATFYLDLVEALADSAHMLTVRLAGIIARADAAGHAARLPIDIRGPELKRIEDAAKRRVPCPVINASDLATGAWVQKLIAQVRLISGRLSALLGRDTSGSLSRQLEELLRLVDDASLSLAKRLNKNERRPAVVRPAQIERETQEQCRAARLAGFHFDWAAGWDLAVEIEAIAEPLEAAMAALSDPARLAPQISALAEAVHEGVAEIADLVHRAEAAKRTGHLTMEQRVVARRLLLDLAASPAQIVITTGHLARGDWALGECARPYSEPLAQLLETNAIIGGQSVSDVLSAVLKRIDAAALTLRRKIERVEAAAKSKPSPAVAAPAPADKADRARAELSRLGVPLP